MIPDWAWSYLLTAVGVPGFILAGRKVWWAWWINVGCQALWVAYALATEQYGFILAAAVYLTVFVPNAVRWTREHRAKPCTCWETVYGVKPDPDCARHAKRA